MAMRKGAVLAASMISAALVITGISAADDDESPLHKIMEKVNIKNGSIPKNTRTAAAFKKNQKEVVTAAEDLVKLGKEARPFTEPAKKEKQPQEKWNELMDAFIKETETFAKSVAKKDMTQPQAKTEYKAISASCTNCHKIFRKDEE